MTRPKTERRTSADDAWIAKSVSVALDRLGEVWGVPELGTTLTVRLSPRLRASLGRATPATGRVSLHPGLRVALPELLREVLCHEIAHVVAYRRAQATGARRPRAHGAEWAALVRAAGYEPVVRAPRAWIAQVLPQPSTTSRRRRVLHLCPVCQTQRVAQRAVPAWRCSACAELGLDGRMEVIRLPRTAMHE
jgi:predicted SprT family Zn-dependent metalloprotease